MSDVPTLYHFFLCSSIDTPPGPSDTIMRRPPITERVCNNKPRVSVNFPAKLYEKHENLVSNYLEKVVFEKVSESLVIGDRPPGIVVKVKRG